MNSKLGTEVNGVCMLPLPVCYIVSCKLIQFHVSNYISFGTSIRAMVDSFRLHAWLSGS